MVSILKNKHQPRTMEVKRTYVPLDELSKTSAIFDTGATGSIISCVLPTQLPPPQRIVMALDDP